MIKKGDKGVQVAEIQKMLSFLGYDLIVDSNFGKITEESVIKFQKSNNLLDDGIVGNITLNKLKEVFSKNIKFKEEIKKPENINFDGLDVDFSCLMPDQQFIKQITEKNQIYLHFTAGGPSAKNTIKYWDNDVSQVSTAFVVDGDTGKIYQSFNPDYWGWHLGVKGTNGKLDKNSIGIEICAYGPLINKDDKFYAWPKNYSTPVAKEHVYKLDKSFRGYDYYYAFSDSQISNLEKLLLILIKKYKIKVQKSFDEKWLEFNQELIDNCLPGIWSHSNVRKDKFDIYPDKRIFEMLNRIAKQFN